MSGRHPNRGLPVMALNRTPRRQAYACYTEDDYKAAERFFNSSYLERERTLGPSAPLTNACLNNWIVALIKVHQYERAVTVCKNKLQYLESVNMQRSACFICIQCILACSLFLSGDIVPAADLYDEIRAHQGTIADVLAQDAFEVLSLVRLTQKDCLVFWDSNTSLSILVPVTDYINQLDGQRPKKSLLSSGLGSLRRLTLLNQSSLQEEDPERLNNKGRLLSLFKRLLRFDRGSRSRSPFDFHKAGRTLPPSTQQSGRLPPCLHYQENFGTFDLGQEGDAPHSDDIRPDWPGNHIEALPIPDIPQTPNVDAGSFDPSSGYTFRSVDTTTSSQPVDSHGRSLLAITAWAAKRQPFYIETQLNAKLDTGAQKNVVSEEFASTIGATIDYSDRACATGLDGTPLQVVGSVMIGFKWETSSGTNFGKVHCYVVTDSRIGMVFCESVINKLHLFNEATLQAPVLLTQKTRQEKRDNASHSSVIAAAHKTEADRLAAARADEHAKIEAAERAKNEDDSRVTSIAAVAIARKGTPQSRADSLLGGSDTTAASIRSSLTDFTTISTITSSPILRTASSEFQRPQQLASSAPPSLSISSSNRQPSHQHHLRTVSPSSSTLSSSSFQQPQRALSGHRRSDAKYWHM